MQSFPAADVPRGYPQLASFLASDSGYMQFRGFAHLHSRLLLAEQYHVERLERELEKIDKWTQDHGGGIDLQCKLLHDQRSRREDMPMDFPFGRTRPEVLAELKSTLRDYGE